LYLAASVAVWDVLDRGSDSLVKSTSVVRYPAAADSAVAANSEEPEPVEVEGNASNPEKDCVEFESVTTSACPSYTPPPSSDAAAVMYNSAAAVKILYSSDSQTQMAALRSADFDDAVTGVRA
jgi:hypothetical protein